MVPQLPPWLLPLGIHDPGQAGNGDSRNGIEQDGRGDDEVVLVDEVSEFQKTF